MHDVGKPMAPITVIRMRADGWCPNCHEQGHMDRTATGRVVCTKSMATSAWPHGGYHRHNQLGPFPSALANFVGILWKRAHPSN